MSCPRRLGDRSHPVAEVELRTRDVVGGRASEHNFTARCAPGSQEIVYGARMESMLRKLSQSIFVIGLVVGGLEGSAAATRLDGFSADGPAMADFNGQLCVAWSGEDVANHLTITCSDTNG